MLEVWKDIKRFNGNYSISNCGNVRNNRTGKILKSHVSDNGYLHVTVNPFGEFKSYNIRIHREVAIAFIPNPSNKPEVNHIDCDKTNPNVRNLEWATSKENAEHANENNLITRLRGEDNVRSKFTEDFIEKIRKLYIPYHKKYGLRALGKEYGFHHTAMSKALLGTNWKHLHK